MKSTLRYKDAPKLSSSVVDRLDTMGNTITEEQYQVKLAEDKEKFRSRSDLAKTNTDQDKTTACPVSPNSQTKLTNNTPYILSS